MRRFVGQDIRDGVTIVLTHGTFDLVHPGHIRTLEFARQQGDKLFVALSSDHMAALRKGPERPIQKFQSRKVVLDALRCVDGSFEAAAPTDDLVENLVRIVEKLQPDVFVSSYGETRKYADRFQKAGTKLVVAPVFDGGTTSELIKTVVGRYAA